LAHDALGEEASDVELTIIDRNLATLTPDSAARLQLARRAWVRTRDVLGVHHLRTLQAQTLYALLQTDTATAYSLLSPVCGEYQRSNLALRPVMLDCFMIQGSLAGELGDYEEMRRAYAQILATTESSSDPDELVSRQLATAELAMLDHQFDRAVAAYKAI